MAQLRKISLTRTFIKLSLIFLSIGISLLLYWIAVNHKGFFFLLIPFCVFSSVWAQHAIAEEVHEGAHKMLSPWGPLDHNLSNFYSAVIGGSFTVYQQTHLKHHQFFGTIIDPDYIIYSSAPNGILEWLKYIFWNFSGVGAINRVLREKGISDQRPLQNLFVPAVCALGIWSVTTIFVGPFWYPFFWMVPLITITFGITQLRTLLEHGVNEENMESFDLCDFKGAIQGQIFAAQFGYRYHATHHIYPTVPNYNLKKIFESKEAKRSWRNFEKSESTFFKRLMILILRRA